MLQPSTVYRDNDMSLAWPEPSALSRGAGGGISPEGTHHRRRRLWQLVSGTSIGGLLILLWVNSMLPLVPWALGLSVMAAITVGIVGLAMSEEHSPDRIEVITRRRLRGVGAASGYVDQGPHAPSPITGAECCAFAVSVQPRGASASASVAVAATLGMRVVCEDIVVEIPAGPVEITGEGADVTQLAARAEWTAEAFEGIVVSRALEIVLLPGDLVVIAGPFESIDRLPDGRPRVTASADVPSIGFISRVFRPSLPEARAALRPHPREPT